MENKTNEFENYSLNNVSNSNINNELLEETKKQTEKMDQANVSLENLYKLILEMKNSLNKEEKPLNEEIINETEPPVEENKEETEDVAPVQEEVAEAPVVEEPVIETPDEVKVETPVVEPPVELNPVLEQTMELPQEDIVTPEEDKKEDTIIGIDELLSSVPEVAAVEEPVIETPTEVAVETPTEEIKMEEPKIEETSIEPVEVEAPVQVAPVIPEVKVEKTPVVEESKVEVQPEVQSTNEVVEQAVTVDQPVVSAPVETPVVPQVQEALAEDNIEIIDSTILDEASVHADGKQRAIEVDNEIISNKVNNQKTLINKVA